MSNLKKNIKSKHFSLLSYSKFTANIINNHLSVRLFKVRMNAKWPYEFSSSIIHILNDNFHCLFSLSEQKESTSGENFSNFPVKALEICQFANDWPCNS